jgi:hypothetical protein
MERIILERFESTDQGTFGKIRINDETFYTLELPWRDNRNDISCIPAGNYECEFSMSAHFKRKLYLVNGISGRFGVRIHSANFAGDKDMIVNGKKLKSQLHGCIALGLHTGAMGGQKCLLLSSVAVRKFENLMNRESFLLEVMNVF